MTHRRKLYVVYPPDYQPGDGYKKRFSRLQATKTAARMGEGASILCWVHIHPSPRKEWRSATPICEWWIRRMDQERTLT